MLHALALMSGVDNRYASRFCIPIGAAMLNTEESFRMRYMSISYAPAV